MTTNSTIRTGGTGYQPVPPGHRPGGTGMTPRLENNAPKTSNGRRLFCERTRPPRVPEARMKLAGGDAQRNHRNNRPSMRCAAAGRENRATAPPRPALVTLRPSPSLPRFSRPAGTPGLVATRNRWFQSLRSLHHRLISSMPPASSVVTTVAARCERLRPAREGQTPPCQKRSRSTGRHHTAP